MGLGATSFLLSDVVQPERHVHGAEEIARGSDLGLGRLEGSLRLARCLRAPKKREADGADTRRAPSRAAESCKRAICSGSWLTGSPVCLGSSVVSSGPSARDRGFT